MRTVRVLISGAVQGVSFRAWTRQEACALGLNGWVRNRRDGSVEAVLSGPTDQVDGMLEALEYGPRLAEVAKVEIVEVGGKAPADGFAVWKTA